MNILVLTHEYPPVGGGGGRVAQDICLGLAKRGHFVKVLTAHHADLPMVEDAGGMRIIRLKSGRRFPFRADLRAMTGYIWACFWEGLKVIHQWKPDVIHVHFAVPAGAAAYMLNRLTGVQYVLTAHLGDVPGGVPEKTGKWFRWIFPFTPPIWKRAARVAAVSSFTRDLALVKYPVAISVIPNGVDLHAIDPGEIRPNHPPRVVFAGRFMQQKNPLQIVRTLAELRNLSWSGMLVGDGPLKAEMQNEIDRLDLADRISLPGWLSPEQVLDHFRASDILFMPSLSEGLPVVGVQALAMGLALVLSNVGGNAGLIDQGVNGMLVEQGDLPGYKNALQSLLSDPQKLLKARQASRRWASQFDLAAVVESYENLFRQAADEVS